MRAAIKSLCTCTQVVEKRKDQRVRVQRLSRSLKKLGRSVGRRDRNSIARQAVRLVGKELAKELKQACSVDSILRRVIHME